VDSTRELSGLVFAPDESLPQSEGEIPDASSTRWMHDHINNINPQRRVPTPVDSQHQPAHLIEMASASQPEHLTEMASASQPSSATPVDPPEITQSTAPTWLKLINLRSASPAEVALLNNQHYLLSVLQNIMRSQEALIIQVER
jgi:hypothetical protein